MIKKLVIHALLVLSYHYALATEWAYLYSDAFKTRYVLAAYEFEKNNVQEIIEIGGYKTPISQFLKNRQVTVINPLTAPYNNDDGTVVHLNSTWQDWKDNPKTNNYGVVILGIDLQDMNTHDWQRLYKLIEGSRITVIEIPACWVPSQKQFAQILQNTSKKIYMQIKLDFAHNDFGDLKNSHPPRTERIMFFIQ